jgi:thiol-disulfide isomerase/thioredoxin
MKLRLLFLVMLSANVYLLSAQGTIYARPRNQERNQIVDAFKKSLLKKPLPDFNFEDISGNKLKKKDFAGKVIVINFWFTSCQPCINEMPLLNNLVAAYNDTNVVFIAPALSAKESIERFLKKYQFDYQIVPEQEDYATKLKVENFPTHIIVDKKGIIRFVEIGYNPHIKETLGQYIDSLK